MAKKFTLTKGQKDIFNLIKDFVKDNRQKVFILKGYAGTGKTTLVRHVIEHFVKEDIRFNLLATTGRAATILSDITGHPAETIHSMIYNYSDINQDMESVIKTIDDKGVEATGQLYLTFDLKKVDPTTTNTIYIVDESSMLSNEVASEVSQAWFGSGKLLSDLLEFDPKGKFIFVGDACQLPPVGQTHSPALSTLYFNQELNILANSRELTEIVRQKGKNDIIEASVVIRGLFAIAPESVEKGARVNWGRLPFRGYSDIEIHSTFDTFLKQYLDLVKKEDYKYATLICDSNKRTRELALQVRRQLGFADGCVQEGDLLLVTQNNSLSGLTNGDFVIVKKVSPSVVNRAYMSFRQVEVQNISTDEIFSQFIIEEVLYSAQPNLDKRQQMNLTIDFARRMLAKGIKQGTDMFNRAMLEDPYFNALRCVFGYAITCHKSQGGEWAHVFVDLGKGRLMANPTKASYQWIYTAMTRAKEKLHFVDGWYFAGHS